MTTEEIYSIYLSHPSVTTDTRKIKEGDIFFALTGPNFDGNMYAREALDKGAAFCICERISDVRDDRIIYVDNVLQTLHSLAKKHREQFHIPVIGITGSNGKTTTKELVHAVLSEKYRCSTTEGNLNNHIGVPLTILKWHADTEIAVVEMGANHLNEIEGYCKYAMPTHGLITNCGKAHLEGFGSEEGVKKGKGELFDYLSENDGIVFINNDLDYLEEMSKHVKKKISYGTQRGDITGTEVTAALLLETEINYGTHTQHIKTNLAGGYNLSNVLAAVIIGKTFDVEESQIKHAIENYIPVNSRSQIKRSGSNTWLLDAYNANPGSMTAAIENFAAMPGNKKIVILGGMKELGEESIKEHQMIIDLLKKYQWHAVALAGEDFKNLPADYFHFADASETAEWFKLRAFTDSLILLKGSRGMAMEKLLE